ncbi:hypothetical protein [Caballeronia sp. AAUFL_F2_KS46]|uniref:hypothetical protein n=1 Tax=Caballeronia sp. AAUFL_F2_KS46 TaxID=2921780 RepID=UPI002027AA79|nr:hypothetical protein [Caballeronia sp. AAUFL_F2_KS46]
MMKYKILLAVSILFFLAMFGFVGSLKCWPTLDALSRESGLVNALTVVVPTIVAVAFLFFSLILVCKIYARPDKNGVLTLGPKPAWAFLITVGLFAFFYRAVCRVLFDTICR